VYFWWTRALAEDLRAGRVSERQRMWYLLGQTILVTGVPVGFQFREAWPSLPAPVEWLVIAAINAAGVLYCYEANQQGDDRDFVSRFVCLSWPISMRMLALFAIVMAGLFALGLWRSWRPGRDDPRTALLFLGLGCTLNVVYYWRLRSHLRWIAAPSP
jgi:hypothetical protein